MALTECSTCKGSGKVKSTSQAPKRSDNSDSRYQETSKKPIKATLKKKMHDEKTPMARSAKKWSGNADKYAAHANKSKKEVGYGVKSNGDLETTYADGSRKTRSNSNPRKKDVPNPRKKRDK
jgi:hypothetical protein